MKGFVWRNQEQPKSVEDLFVDDPELILPQIKGLKTNSSVQNFFDKDQEKPISEAVKGLVKNENSEDKSKKTERKTSTDPLQNRNSSQNKQ